MGEISGGVPGVRDVLVQLTDLHVQVGPGDAEASARVVQAVELVLALEPAPVAVLLTGDLVNSADAAEYARLAELLAPLEGLRLLPAVGNHDDRALLRETFASVPEIAALGDARHVQYVAQAGSFRVVVLDTQRAGSDAGKLCDTRLAWIEEAVAPGASTPPAPTLVAMHHPAFRIGIPALDDLGLPDDQRSRFAQLLHPAVELVVSGHVHRTVSGRVGAAAAFGCPSVFLPSVPTLGQTGRPALADGPVGIAVHARLDDGSLASHVRIVGGAPTELAVRPPPA